MLDRFGAVEKGHTAAARHLYDAHHVDGWYAQGITVAYERARGVRALNQRCDGEYQVSVSKVVAADTADVIKAFTETRRRRRWVEGVDARLVSALSAALDSPASKGFVVRADGQARFRYKWDGTTVQLYLLPKPGGKVSVVVTNTKLPGGRHGGRAARAMANCARRRGRAPRGLTNRRVVTVQAVTTRCLFRASCVVRTFPPPLALPTRERRRGSPKRQRREGGRSAVPGRPKGLHYTGVKNAL